MPGSRAQGERRDPRDSGSSTPASGRTIVAGFSQGAELTYALAQYLHGPDFLVACPMAGQLPPQLLKEAKPAGARAEFHGFPR